MGAVGNSLRPFLVLQACDAARADSPLTGHTWVPVNTFMRELVAKEGYNSLEESFPQFYRQDQNKTFAATFEGYGIWFNHVIKVEDSAMILCSNNQAGVDIVIPICQTERPLSCHSVTATLVQVKNDERYKYDINKSLFDHMDPIKLGLFPRQDSDRVKLIPRRGPRQGHFDTGHSETSHTHRFCPRCPQSWCKLPGATTARAPSP